LDGLSIGDRIITSNKRIDLERKMMVGCSFYIKDIPIGSLVNSVELDVGGGGKMIRSAGSSAKIMRAVRLENNNIFVCLRLPSGEKKIC